MKKKRHLHPELETLRTPLSDSEKVPLAELSGLAGGYKAVQLLISAVAFLFGPVLIVGYCFVVGRIEVGGSMSSYYNSDLRDVFVGMLFALAFLFSTYHFRAVVWREPGLPARSEEAKKRDADFRLDNWMANLAGVAAALVALCPTNSNPAGDPDVPGVPGWHAAFGTTMFVMLALFAGWRFRKSAGGPPTPQKQKRNHFYLGCAIVMALGLALFGLGDRLGLPSEFGLFGEVIALWAFSASWLLKSDYLPCLRDLPKGEVPSNSPAGDGKVQNTQRAWRSTVRDGPVKSVGMWLAGKIDRDRGWYRLHGLPALLTLLGIRMRLRRENLFDTTGVTVGWGPERPVSSRRLTRSIDGTETDPYHPEMGAVGSRFGRNIAPDQLDSTDRARVMSPNPRTVSNELLARRTFVPASGLNMLFAAWIQFEVHDWMHHLLDEDHPWEVVLDAADPWDGARTENGAMPILRTEADAAYGGGDDPPNYVSTSTHWWDASQIYGTDPRASAEIRSGLGGRLKLTDDGRLPFDPANPEDPLVKKLKELGGGSALVGASNGWWLGLAMLHTLFMREHNAICDHLARSYRTWTDQQLFDTARLVNAALMAKIHTVEWTPALLANPVLERGMKINWWGFEGQAVERWLGRLVKSEEVSGIPGTDLYYHGVPYAITEEFVAVYRLHPLIPDDYEIRSAADNSLLQSGRFGEISGRYVHDLLQSETISMSDLLYSFATAHPGQAVLHNFPEELRTFADPDAGMVDLAAIDILRNRERGVPRYNEFRRQLRLKPAKEFKDFSDDPAIVDELAKVYATPEDVDLLIGLYAERKPEGFAISDTAFRVFILMASRRLKSDRFFTYDYRPGVYTQEGLDWIDTNTLASVIVRHHPDLAGVVRLDNAFKPWSVA